MTAGPGRLHALVRGRVQGVGFRATTADEARRLSLAGWVRNRADGSVEVLAEGSAEALEALESFLRTGPRTAHVSSLQVDRGTAQGAPFPFETRRTE